MMESKKYSHPFKVGTLKVIFNANSCHIRREVVSRHIDRHRAEITRLQTAMANHPGFGINEFHRKFNKLEKRHKLLIAKITLHEATKKCN